MQVITPQNETDWLSLRTKDITSTEISSLFGISPYCTAYELWHKKKSGEVFKIEENERMLWGQRLQDTIAKYVAEEQCWDIRRMTEYGRIPELKIGSSFDFSIKSDDGLEDGLLEIKNVDGLVFLNEWTENNSPLHIEIQVQHQLLVSGRPLLYLVALVGGNRVVIIKRTPDQKVHDAIKCKVAEFWKSIEENNPPHPDMLRDADFISSLYGYGEPGKVITLSDSGIKGMALKYKEYGEIIKDAESVRDSIKAQILMRIGDAEKAIGEGYSISAGMVGPTHIEYERAGYRLFKVNIKKGG